MLAFGIDAALPGTQGDLALMATLGPMGKGLGKAFGAAGDDLLSIVAREGDVAKALRSTEGKGLIHAGNKLFKQYIDELEAASGGIRMGAAQRAEIAEAIRATNYAKLRITGDELQAVRRDFNRMRPELMAEWSQRTGHDWPTYKSTVLKENGDVWRLKGAPYDAHHVTRLGTSGPNQWWNMFPVRVEHHVPQVHNPNSMLNQLERKYR
jgi:hypothetical protein